MEYYRPTLLNVAGMDPLAWRITFTGGDNIILSQSMTARTILISATLQTGGGGTSVTITADSSFPDQPLIAMSRLGITGIATISSTDEIAYFTYVGYWPAGIVFKYVEGEIINQASANSPAEVGLFTSISAPNKDGQTLTRIAVATLVTNLTVAGRVFRNIEAFTNTLMTNSFLWCGVRAAMAPTKPRYSGLVSDMQQGHVLRFSTAPALTSTTSWLATLIPITAPNPEGADLRATMV